MKTNIAEAQFEVKGRTFKIELRRRGYEDKGSKSVAYVWSEEAIVPGGDIDVNKFVGPYAKAAGADSVYTRRGDYPIVDKAYDLMNKLIVNYKAEILAAGFASIKEAAQQAIGYSDWADVKAWKFSPRAGCACGCSPGFSSQAINRYNIFIGLDEPFVGPVFIPKEKRV